jgi:Uma2 family endonuclease
MTPATQAVTVLPETGTGPTDGPPLYGLTPEDFPDIESLVIEDGKSVESIFSEKQMRLLTEPLHSSWVGPSSGEPFVVMADVGVFHTSGMPPLVPDVFLAVGVRQNANMREKANRSYFVWLRGKVPDVTFEIVSNDEGGEDTDKLRGYERMGVSYYVIFDPLNLLKGGVVRVYERCGTRFRLIDPPWFFAQLGLGIKLWAGQFEDMTATWLRWCDHIGNLIPTGAELAQMEREKVQRERERADEADKRALQLQAELEKLRAELQTRGTGSSAASPQENPSVAE